MGGNAKMWNWKKNFPDVSATKKSRADYNLAYQKSETRAKLAYFS